MTKISMYRVAVLVLQLLILCLFVWFLGALVYFSKQLATVVANDAVALRRYGLATLLDSVAIVAGSYAVARLLRRNPLLMQHGLLSIGLFMFDFFVDVSGQPDIHLVWLNLETTDGSLWLKAVYALNVTLIGNVLLAFLRRDRNREHTISEQAYELMVLKQMKTKAELESLQARVNPHFLYNALNSIASLIRFDAASAERMVMLLARFFRSATGARSSLLTSLGEELDMVRTYLDVEGIRFGNRLSYEVIVKPTSLMEVPIPRFLIQPLVENAIKHGIAQVDGPTTITIRVAEENERIYIDIEDNGPPFPPDIPFGYGLRSTYEKVQLLYEESARVEIIREPRKAVRLVLPLVSARLSAFSTALS